MILRKEKFEDFAEPVFILEMNADEYGLMCNFMKINAIGFGPNRSLTNKWFFARREMLSQENAAKEKPILGVNYNLPSESQLRGD